MRRMRRGDFLKVAVGALAFPAGALASRPGSRGTTCSTTSTVTSTVTTTTTATTTTTVQPPASAPQLFAANSPLNQPIPGSAPTHPDSAAMIACPQWDDGNAWMLPNVARLYYEAPAGFAGVPTIDCYVNNVPNVGLQCASSPTTVPFPQVWRDILNSADYTSGLYGGDADTTIWEAGSGDAWVGYHVTPPGQPSRNISCSSTRWNAVIMQFVPGLFKGIGCGQPWIPPSGSGITAGLVTPADLADPSGVIGHAIQLIYNSCPYPNDVHPPFVFPASGAANDGQVVGRGAIPTGARIQLDPTINVDTWPSLQNYPAGTSAALKKIARTAQVYGFVTVDGMGGTSAAGQINVAQVAPLGQNGYAWESEYPAPYYGFTLATALPQDLYARMRVIDWTQWTG